jgi:hypothetical protein
MRQFLADIGAGWGLAEIWNFPGYWQWTATISLIIFRIWLELLILKNKRKEREKE